MSGSVTLIGCGFVADLYMRSLKLHPEIRVLGAHDRDAHRMATFCNHWNIPQLPDLATALDARPREGVLLNLTNPGEHATVIRAGLTAGCHVFTEKPMVLDMAEASSLHALAEDKGLQLATAPASVLGEAAQTLARAVRDGLGGTPRLIHAELDDGFVPQAPLHQWKSESGAPWPFEDEFRVGCTLEHAGYALSWLIAIFGPVRRVVTSAHTLLGDKCGVIDGAPDFSVATLDFVAGPVARLSCSITAPHDHRLRVVGDAGVLEVPELWDNAAPVRYRRRFRVRRRLMESPLPRRIRLKGPTHPKLRRRGAAAMNFALGPAEMLAAIAEGRQSRLAGDYALHLTEVTLACQRTGVHRMDTTCTTMEPMPWAR